MTPKETARRILDSMPDEFSWDDFPCKLRQARLEESNTPDEADRRTDAGRGLTQGCDVLDE